MKIRKIIIMAIRGNTKLKRRLMDALDVSAPTLSRYLNVENDKHEDLTKAAALRVIREELDLTDDEILEEEAVNNPKIN